MQSLISITFDDGFRSQFDNAVPILNRCAMPATFFLIANKDETHERSAGHTNDWWKIDWRDDDIEMLKKLAHDGHEIGSHSVTHDLETMPTQPETEVCESKRLIEGWLGMTVSSFCYPFYRSHAYLVDAVKRAGYAQARGGGIPPNYGPRSTFYAINNDPPLDKFNVDCRQLSNDEKVTDWVRPGYWHVLTYHGIGSDRDGWVPIPVQQFASQMEELAQLRDSGAVEVVTFNEAASRVGG